MDTFYAETVVAKDDADKIQLAERIHQAVQAEIPLKGKLVRVTKSDEYSVHG